MPKSYDCSSLNEQLLMRLAYRDLGPIAAWRWHRHIRSCASCQRRFESAQMTRRAVAGLRPVSPPSGVVERVMGKTAGRPRRSLRPGLGTLRPVLLAALVFLVLLSIMNERAPQKAPAYSEAQVQESRREIERTLGMLGRIMTRTRKAVTQEVLSERVVEPMKKSVITAFKTVSNGG